MSGREGVYDATMLLRRVPFAEWVVVYYDPRKTTAPALQKLMRDAGCPRATQVQQAGKSIVMNPYAAPGDTLQLRVIATAAGESSFAQLPEGWVVEASDLQLEKGENFISVRTTPGARKKKYKLTLRAKGGESHTLHAELVGRVPG